jgi:hypothetical protein
MPEYAISGGPIKLNAGNNTGGLVVRFYQREIPLIQRFPIWVDQMGGKPVEGATEFADYVQISHAGESLNVIDRRATDEDKKRYAEQWERYQAGKDQIPGGTPITLLFKAHPGILRTLERESVLTVEALAGLSSHAIQSIGMGCQDWVTSAKRYLEHASKGIDEHRFSATIAELQEQNAQLNQQVTELRQTVEQLLKALPVKANSDV